MSARQSTVCGLVTLAFALGLLLLGAPPALSLSAPTPWDGVNPFHCTIQDAGQGTTVPDPGADPYCVRFDKTNQNVTELGLVDFLSKEPARVAAAVPKCFYYQEDHWRGSLIQSDQQTVVYEFYGHYFFNKATGDGGVWVTGFTIAGQTFDPRTLPGFPPQWDPYFGPGTGGVTSHNDVPVDPSCVAKASNPPAPIYAPPPTVAPPPATAPPQATLRCASASGRVTARGLGPLNLGTSKRALIARLGSPERVKGRLLYYCLSHGGILLAGERGRHPRTVLLLTTSRAFTLRGARGGAIHVGASVRALRAAFPSAKRLMSLGHTTMLEAVSSSSQATAGTVIAEITRGRVAYLGVYEPPAIRAPRALAGYARAIR